MPRSPLLLSVSKLSVEWASSSASSANEGPLLDQGNTLYVLWTMYTAGPPWPTTTLRDTTVLELERLADVPISAFEAALEAEKAGATRTGIVTRTGVLRRLNPEREKRPSERYLEADKFVDACELVAKRAEAFMTAVRFGMYPDDSLPLVREAVDVALDKAATAIRDAQREMRRKPNG